MKKLLLLSLFTPSLAWAAPNPLIPPQLAFLCPLFPRSFTLCYPPMQAPIVVAQKPGRQR